MKIDVEGAREWKGEVERMSVVLLCCHIAVVCGMIGCVMSGLDGVVNFAWRIGGRNLFWCTRKWFFRLADGYIIVGRSSGGGGRGCGRWCG